MSRRVKHLEKELERLREAWTAAQALGGGDFVEFDGREGKLTVSDIRRFITTMRGGGAVTLHSFNLDEVVRVIAYLRQRAMTSEDGLTVAAQVSWGGWDRVRAALVVLLGRRVHVTVRVKTEYIVGKSEAIETHVGLERLWGRSGEMIMSAEPDSQWAAPPQQFGNATSTARSWSWERASKNIIDAAKFSLNLVKKLYGGQ